MVLLGLAVSVLSLTLATGETISPDRNSVWRDNDVIMYSINNFYELLAVSTSDVNNRRKRFVSIISQAYMYYISSREVDRVKRVLEAVEKTKQDLDKPTDWIAGQMRAYLIVLKTPLDQEINDIKASCLPETEEADCMSALRERNRRNLARCKEYNKNLELYKKYRTFFADPKFADFVSDVNEISDNNDQLALAYFTYAALVDYAELAEEGRAAYRARADHTYHCSVYNLTSF